MMKLKQQDIVMYASRFAKRREWWIRGREQNASMLRSHFGGVKAAVSEAALEVVDAALFAVTQAIASPHTAEVEEARALLARAVSTELGLPPVVSLCALSTMSLETRVCVLGHGRGGGEDGDGEARVYGSEISTEVALSEAALQLEEEEEEEETRVCGLGRKRRGDEEEAALQPVVEEEEMWRITLSSDVDDDDKGAPKLQSGGRE